MNEDRVVYRKALLWVAVTISAIGVAGIAAAWATGGGRAAGAAAVGAAVAALAGLATPASMLMGSGRPATALAALVGGVWLAKMFAIVAVIAVLSRIDDFPRAPFAWTLLAGMVASLAIDVWAVRSSRVPYVTPDSK